MRARILATVLLVVGVDLAGGPAEALPFTGTFVFRVGAFGAGGFPLPPVAIPGSGTGDPSLPSISPDSFVGSGMVGVTGTPPITQVLIALSGNAAGTVGTGPSFFAGTLGNLTGNVFVRGSGIGLVLFNVPFGGKLGFPGATFTQHSPASATQSASFGGWTSGIATISRSHTGASAACLPGGVTCPTAMLGGATANASSFGGAAQIVLVAPVDIWSSLGAAGVPSFAVMALNYVPEPSALLMLVSGAAALALAGIRRGR